MSEPEIQPFTAEEWENRGHAVFSGYLAEADGVIDCVDAEIEPGAKSRMLAAQILQQSAPDGGPLFTWGDVDALEDAMDCVRGELCHRSDSTSRVWRLLDALRSLLPPQTEPEPKEER